MQLKQWVKGQKHTLMCIEWFSGGDERKGRTEEIHPLKRKVGADLRKVEKLLLSHNKGRKAMEMGGLGIWQRKMRGIFSSKSLNFLYKMEKQGHLLKVRSREARQS